MHPAHERINHRTKHSLDKTFSAVDNGTALPSKGEGKRQVALFVEMQYPYVLPDHLLWRPGSITMYRDNKL